MKILKISLLVLLITAVASTVYAINEDGGEGRTPGYWKNHTLAWTDYEPDDLFSGVFGVQIDGITSLEDALNANGGGVNALSRHAVAALLNASDPDINYPTSVDEITSIFTIVSFAADEDWLDDWIEETKDILDYWNNLGLE